MNMKKWGGALLSLALLLSLLVLPAGAAGSAIGVTIDGQPVAYDDNYGRPFLDQAGRTQVPFRVTMEAFGCTVSWDGETQSAVAEKDGTRVAVPIGKEYMVVDGKPVRLDTVAQIVDTRTYLPIRPVLEAFGAYVTWNSTDAQVVVTTGGNLVRVHFLDAGPGEAIFIDCGETEVLIDGGPAASGAEVVTYLAPYVEGALDYVIATNPADDHIGGLADVLTAYDVGEVITSGLTGQSEAYRAYETALAQNDAKVSDDADRIIPLSSLAALSILETGDDWEEPGDNSVVVELTCGLFQALFTGDMSQTAEAETLHCFGDIDVLKVPRHGGADAASADFLSVVRPEYAVACYDAGVNPPAAQTLQRFQDMGALVYGTGKSGPVVLTTNGWSYSFSTGQTLTADDCAP